MDDSVCDLHIAVINGDLNEVQSLLSNGANVSQEIVDGKTPLHYACIFDSEARYFICKLLLELGSDCNHLDLQGLTPFLSAVRSGQFELVKLMLQYRADIKVADENGMTALHLAALNTDVNVIKYLLDHYNFDIESTTNKGLSALHYAASGANLKVCDFLLKRGAMVDNHVGMTPLALMVAFPSEHDERRSEVVQLLLDNGANVARNVEGHSVFERAINCAGEYTRNVLMQHMAKMHHLNLTIHPRDRQTIENDDYYYSVYYKMCLQELERMKGMKFYNDVSAFDILTGTRKVISGYAKNKELVGAFEEENYDTKFPIYASSMKKRFHVEVEKQMKLNTAANVLSHLFGFHDPTHPAVQKILSYLSDEDLEFLKM